MVQHIKDTIRSVKSESKRDKTWWMSTSDEKFTVKDAY